MLKMTLAGVVCAVSVTAATNKDWPMWRGPLMSGEAPGANPPTTWSETENIKWKIPAPGEGHATPIVLGNQIFIQAAVPTKKAENTAAPAAAPAPAPGEGQGGGRRGGGGRFGGGTKPTDPMEFVLISLDRETGKTNWRQTARTAVPHEGKHGTGSFASSSPVTDGDNLYAFFGSQGVYCYDTKGNLKWSKDLGDMQVKNEFGEGSSPAVHGKYLVINWDHEGEDFIVALDKNSGAELWRTPREEGTSWSTPLIVEHGGKAQVVVAATGRVRSYDLETGKQIWDHAGLTQNAIPTPIESKGVVYVTSGFRGAALYAIKLGKTGDLTDTDSVLWKHAKNTPYVPSALLVGDRFYFLSGNVAMLSIFDVKSGKALVDAERLPGLGGIYASPVAAGGKVYIASQNGATLVLKDSDKVEVLATNTLDDRFDASPAIVGNTILLRGAKNLYCIAGQ